MPFAEDLTFPQCVAIRATGGPGTSTEVVSVSSGWEQRNANWKQSRRAWQVGLVARVLSEWEMIDEFFEVVDGRATAFRFEDPLDHDDRGRGVVAVVANFVQLQKAYRAGSRSKLRDIQKPKGTIALFRDGSPITVTVDLTTGHVTMPALSTAGTGVSAITKSLKAQVTDPAHGLSSGDIVRLTGVSGMTQINQLVSHVTVIDADTFTMDDVNSTGFSTYVSAGTVQVLIENLSVVTWTGRFDVPVRFDTDKLDGEIVDRNGGQGELLVQCSSIPLLEVRV